MDEKTQTLLTTIAENEQKVYEAGVEAGIVQGQGDIWDMMTNGRKQYNAAFAYWRAEYLRPPFKIIPTADSPTSMFGNMVNLKKIEKAYFDLSQLKPSQTDKNSGCATIWNGCEKVEEIEDIGLPAGCYYYTWNNCYELHTIEVVRSTETTMFTSTFIHCRSLINVAFEGIIGKDIVFSECPLSVDSMKNIISHLKDYSTEEVADNHYKYTVTFKTSAFEALEAEGFADEDKTWLAEKGITYSEDLTWAMVIDNLKWNLVSA